MCVFRGMLIVRQVFPLLWRSKTCMFTCIHLSSRREVVVAMLQPHTDFGWHGSYDDTCMSNVEKRTLLRVSPRVSSMDVEKQMQIASSIDDDEDAIKISDSETKTVLQIHDAGRGTEEGGGDVVHLDNPMETTPKALSETPPGTWHRWGRGGGEEEVHV